MTDALHIWRGRKEIRGNRPIRFTPLRFLSIDEARAEARDRDIIAAAHRVGAGVTHIIGDD